MVILTSSLFQWPTAYTKTQARRVYENWLTATSVNHRVFVGLYKIVKRKGLS